MDLHSTLHLAAKLPTDPITSTILRGFYESYRFRKEIQTVNEQTKDLLATTNHVAFNIVEARRLYRTKTAFMEKEERMWVDNVMKDTQDAMLDVAKLLEPARIDRSLKKETSLTNKTTWVLTDHGRIMDKHARLTICHQSLTAVIARLGMKVSSNIGPIAEDTAEQPLLHDPQMQKFLQWKDQRMRRKSMTALRPSPARSSLSLSTNSESTDSTSVSSKDSPETSGTSPSLLWTPRSPDMGRQPGSQPVTRPKNELHSRTVSLDRVPQHLNQNREFASPSSDKIYQSPIHYLGEHDKFPAWSTAQPASRIDTSPRIAPPINYDTHPSNSMATPPRTTEYGDGLEVCDPQTLDQLQSIWKRDRTSPGSTPPILPPWAYPSDPVFPFSPPFLNTSEQSRNAHPEEIGDRSPQIGSPPDQSTHSSVHAPPSMVTDETSKKEQQQPLPHQISRAYSDSYTILGHPANQETRDTQRNRSRSSLGSGTSTPTSLSGGRGRRSWLAFHASRDNSVGQTGLT